jgi:hypothetical protein
MAKPTEQQIQQLIRENERRSVQPDIVELLHGVLGITQNFWDADAADDLYWLLVGWGDKWGMDLRTEGCQCGKHGEHRERVQ